MRFQRQLNGKNIILILEDKDDDLIRRTFDSFFHHGAIDKETSLQWVYELNGGGRAFFFVNGKSPEECRIKIIRAFTMMNVYKKVNEKLNVSKPYLDSVLNKLNLTETEYDEYLCELYKPYFYAKAVEWFDSIESYNMIHTASFCIGDPAYRSNWFVDYYDLGVVDDNVYEHEMKAVKEGVHNRTMRSYKEGYASIS